MGGPVSDAVHPESYCHRCGAPNPSWSVDSELFNTALGGPTAVHEGIVCVSCFVLLHEAATGLTCTWQLSPRSNFIAQHVVNP